MSIHKDCGQQVVWMKREDDPHRFLPPKEAAGQAYVFGEDGVGMTVSIYVDHYCDPEKVVAWAAYQQELSNAKAMAADISSGNLIASSNQSPTLPNAQPEKVSKPKVVKTLAERLAEEDEVSSLVTCPSCNMAPRDACINLNVYKMTGVYKETKRPHPSRIRAGYKMKEEES